MSRSEPEQDPTGASDRKLFEVIEDNRPGLYYLLGTAILSLGVGMTYTVGHSLIVLGFLLVLVGLLELNAEVSADD
jgi:hypothetical protein